MLVVAHDAGGAEIISAWLRKNRGCENVDFLLEGPAVKIFQGKLSEVNLVSREDVFAGLANYERVLTGTGWGADLEKKVISRSRGLGIYCASYLDHWTNYKERFSFEGHSVLPDEIWVGDEYARDLARDIFTGTVVKLEPNQYLVDCVDQIRETETKSAAKEGAKASVLYICEPRTMKYGDPNYWGYTEYQALEGYLRFLGDQSESVGEIRVRLHPSELSGKYDQVIRRFTSEFTINESFGTRLYEDCAWADWVIGCDSMAMVVALLAGKKVFSCIPPGGRKIVLPFREIIRLF